MSSTETPDVPTRDVPPLGEDVHDTADRIVRRYPVARSALLPLLHLVQSVQNHITDEGIAFCAAKVGLTRAEVGAVATFYTMYKRQPVGDWLLSVCTNPPCKIAGGQQIYDGYVETLGGHSDADTKVTVEHAECLGICDGAPVVQVNYEMFGPMTVEEGAQLLDDCRRGDPPVSPWSGEKPPTFAEVERDLSGANDAWEDQLHLAARQQVAFDSPPSYRTGETDLPVTHPGGDPAGVGGALFRDEAAGVEGDDVALGRPEAPVDPDASDASAMDGTVAQRIGEADAADMAAADPGRPRQQDVDVPVPSAADTTGDVPADAEALTVEAAPDSSSFAGDARETQEPTAPTSTSGIGDAGDDATEGTAATASGDRPDAVEQPDSEPGDLDQAAATGGGEDPPSAEGPDDDTVEAGGEPAGVTAAAATASAGSVPRGEATERLRAKADQVETDDDGRRVTPDEADGSGRPDDERSEEPGGDAAAGDRTASSDSEEQ